MELCSMVENQDVQEWSFSFNWINVTETNCAMTTGCCFWRWQSCTNIQRAPCNNSILCSLLIYGTDRGSSHMTATRIRVQNQSQPTWTELLSLCQSSLRSICSTTLWSTGRVQHLCTFHWELCQLTYICIYTKVEIYKCNDTVGLGTPFTGYVSNWQFMVYMECRLLRRNERTWRTTSWSWGSHCCCAPVVGGAAMVVNL